MKNLRLYFSSPDAGILDKSLVDVIDALKTAHLPFIGPIPLPTGFSSFRPYDGVVTHRRLLDIENPPKGFGEILNETNIPIGVEIRMRYV